MKETQFQVEVINFLKKKDIWHIKYWGGGTYTRSGIPDLLCCVNGQFVAVELKAEAGKTTKLQEYNLTRIRECGGISIVLRPSGFESFKKMIQEVTRAQTENYR